MGSEEGHENDSSDNGEPKPLTDIQKPAGESPNLFLKRSADEDLVNNNDHRRRRQRLDDRENDDTSRNDEDETMEENPDDGEERIKDDNGSDAETRQKKKSQTSSGSLPLGFPTSLLNMNLPGGISSDDKDKPPTLNPQKAAEQLRTIAETISQLTATDANNSNPKMSLIHIRRCRRSSL